MLSCGGVAMDMYMLSMYACQTGLCRRQASIADWARILTCHAKPKQAATAGQGDQVLLASRVQRVPRGGRAYEARPDLLVLVSRMSVVSCTSPCRMFPREEGSLGQVFTCEATRHMCRRREWGSGQRRPSRQNRRAGEARSSRET